MARERATGDGRDRRTLDGHLGWGTGGARLGRGALGGTGEFTCRFPETPDPGVHKSFQRVKETQHVAPNLICDTSKDRRIVHVL